MYGHFTTTTDDNNPLAYSATDFSAHFPILPPPLVVSGNEFDAMSALRSEVGYSSSGCSSYGSPSSLTSYGASQNQSQSQSYLIQRSVSSHSLQKNGFCGAQPVLTPTELVDSETSPVRRVFSTGDLQERINTMQHYHRSESPLSNENTCSIIEGMTKACPYGPEEKKEKIERYRSKRNQRNFNKKIKTTCTIGEGSCTALQCIVMHVGRHWRTVDHGSEGGLQGMMKLMRQLLTINGIIKTVGKKIMRTKIIGSICSNILSQQI